MDNRLYAHIYINFKKWDILDVRRLILSKYYNNIHSMGALEMNKYVIKSNPIIYMYDVTAFVELFNDAVSNITSMIKTVMMQ